ncbi:MAG: (d)CMP kinase [Stellaceae bacterium]|jgi:cytidylate kinase
MIIAVDGPAASGKGTLARRLADHYGLAHLESGRLYRAAALQVLLAGGDPADPKHAEAGARRVRFDQLADPRLKEERISNAASLVAAIPAVRATLLAFQRDFTRKPPDGAKGAVLDGRDIGTVVCPEAPAKLFITASPEARAMRRFKELQASGTPAIYERVLQDMRLRDARDRERRVAPLVRADDAFELDTTALDADAAFDAAVRFVDMRLAKRS